VVVNDVEIANSSAFDLGTHRRYGYKHGYGYAYGYGYGYGRTSKNDEDVGDGDNPDVEHSADGSDSGPETESRSAHDEFADED
jgi:hypothetical protein